MPSDDEDDMGVAQFKNFLAEANEEEVADNVDAGGEGERHQEEADAGDEFGEVAAEGRVFALPNLTISVE